MNRRLLPAALSSLFLLATAPAHVQTADYWGGYSGTHRVDAGLAARWLTWASVNIAGSQSLRPLGVKTMLYTDPNRQIAGEPLYTADESTFAHDCSGARIATSRSGQYLMDPRAPSLRLLWNSLATRYDAEGHFDAIFEDDADDVAYTKGRPCTYQDADWMDATLAMQRSLSLPVIYNGLSNQTGSDVSPAIGLNAAAIGGTMEECYAASAKEPKVGGPQWLAIEKTELQMAAARKLFFCLGLDPSDAASALDGRIFSYASFLLSYDATSSVLWELYRGPSGLHVMPEVQLTPMQPVGRAVSMDAMRDPGGLYTRAYRSCPLAGRDEGPCEVVVNPDSQAHAIDSASYHRRLALNGSDVLDGGTAVVVAGAPPTLAPLSAAILFR
jgi:Hypothetical glycosyl hydrolase family 15